MYETIDNGIYSDEQGVTQIKYGSRRGYNYRKQYEEQDRWFHGFSLEKLMGHRVNDYSTNSYYKPTEKDLLEDYLKAVPDLTIESVAATIIEEQIQKRMDSKDQEILELNERIDKMQQVAESNYKSYEQAKQEIDEYRKELEEKDQRRDVLYDMLDEKLPGWREKYHQLLGWGGRSLTKEERKKVKGFLEQLKNAPPDDYNDEDD